MHCLANIYKQFKVLKLKDSGNINILKQEQGNCGEFLRENIGYLFKINN